jgi:hypothetical protein
VIRGAGAGTVSNTEHFSNAAGECVDNLLGARDGNLFARADTGNLWSIVATKTIGGIVTTLHTVRSRALQATRGTGAVRCPAAIACTARTAFGLAAALDTGRVCRTGATNRGAAILLAVGVCDTHSCDTVGAIARLVDGSKSCSGKAERGGE